MKRKILCLVILSVLLAVPLSNVYAGTFNATFLASQNQEYDAHFGYASWTEMLAFAYTQSPGDTVTLSGGPISGSVTIPRNSDWDQVSSYCYSIQPLKDTTVPSDWENAVYTFSNSPDSRTKTAGGDGTGNFFDPLDTANDVVYSGGANPTISWGAIPGANQYWVRIFALDVGGDITGGPLESYLTGNSGTDTFLNYPGSLFDSGDPHAVLIEARQNFSGYGDLSDNQTINRSRYYDYYNPVPIPGAVWLLGSGLVGLVGFRRKSKK